ncbi:type Z 30S ribosomal protein S14 [Candidatus Gracilibacteria bacterium]|jgi:small subunit ribosomal protein S14|nr:type Z 30S ribosomal protein S14 [Candidatus Gracilibacteria bacterium]
MARTALIVKAARTQRRVANARKAGTTAKLAVRAYNRCKNCGRVRSYLRMFGLCRICVREMANRGELAGVRKSSW